MNYESPTYLLEILINLIKKTRGKNNHNRNKRQINTFKFA